MLAQIQKDYHPVNKRTKEQKIKRSHATDDLMTR
jgi:hypothetical protein